MLAWAFIFLAIAIIAAIIGFTGVFAVAAGVAKIMTFSTAFPINKLHPHFFWTNPKAGLNPELSCRFDGNWRVFARAELSSDLARKFHKFQDILV